MPDGGGFPAIEMHVFAESEKDALQEALELVPAAHPAWQWPGWRVQCYAEHNATVMKARF